MGVAPTEGERRHVTVLFCDICDFSELSEVSDPEEADEVHRLVEELAGLVCRKYDGAVTQVYGEGILIVFGLPNAKEHDARSAVDAALDLRERVRGLHLDVLTAAGAELRLHFGVHSGLVFARAGDTLHGQFDLTGDTVNTASRLCAAAQHDEILVSANALRGIEPFFEVERSQALEFKGKRKPVHAYLVRGRTDVRTRFEAARRRGLTALVSRKDELERLELALKAACQKQVRIVGLIGDAGIGKTRLIEELLGSSSARGVQVLRGHCIDYGDQPPLQPFVQVLRQLFGVRADTPRERALATVENACRKHGELLAPHAASLLHLLALELLPRPVEPRDTLRAVVAALTALTSVLQAGGLALVIDDWQWADDLSHEVLRRLIDALRERGLFVLLSTRSADPQDTLLAGDDADVIQLRPLDREECEQVVHSLLPLSLEVGLTRLIHERTGGNPLFIEELCRAWPADLPSGDRVSERSEVPYTIQGVIQSRVERLPPLERALLRIASVIGTEFDDALLAQVVTDLDVRRALERLRENDMLRQADASGTSRFKHAITREVIYESVRLSERRRIHASVASVLAQRSADSGIADAYEALAYHHVGSGDHEHAARFAELAGDKAALSSSLDRARAHYSTALAQLDALPDSNEKKRRVLDVTVKWARAWVYDQAWKQIEVLERAAAYAKDLGDLERLADVEQMAAWICYALGDQGRAIECCRRGLVVAEEIGNKKLIGQLISNLGQSHAAAGEYPAAIAYLREALNLKRASAKRPQGVPVGSAYALGVVAVIHADRGEVAPATEHMSSALGMVQGSGHAIEGSLLALQGMIELWFGRLDRCIAACARAEATAERIHGAYVFSISRCFAAYARYLLQPAAIELTRLQEAVEWLERRDMGLYLSVAYGCAADAFLRAGQLERARDFATRALRRGEQKDPFGIAVAHRTLATVASRMGMGRDIVASSLTSAFAAADARGSVRESALTRLCEVELGLDGSGPTGLARVHDELAALGLLHHELRAAPTQIAVDQQRK